MEIADSINTLHHKLHAQALLKVPALIKLLAIKKVPALNKLLALIKLPVSYGDELEATALLAPDCLTLSLLPGNCQQIRFGLKDCSQVDILREYDNPAFSL